MTGNVEIWKGDKNPGQQIWWVNKTHQKSGGPRVIPQSQLHSPPESEILQKQKWEITGQVSTFSYFIWQKSTVEKLGKFYLKDQSKDVASFFDNDRKDNYMYKL